MTAAIPIGILGLSRLGTSIGLAIKRFATGKDARQTFTVTGYHTDPDNGAAAKSAKAIDALAKSAAECAADKAIVVLALPPGEVTGGLKLIETALRPGTVILDFSAFKRGAATWGQQAVSRDLHLIGVTALYNPAHLVSGLETVDHAAADLFDGGHLLVAGHADAAPEAIELAADFAALLGAQAHFVDPAEHDVWQVWMTALPAALGAAAFDAVRASDGWDGARRAGNADFARLTHHLADTTAADLRLLLTSDRAGTVRALDAAIAALTRLRTATADPNPAALDELLHQSAEAYNDWYARRRKGQWDDTDDTPDPVSSSLLGGLLGRWGKKK